MNNYYPHVVSLLLLLTAFMFQMLMYEKTFRVLILSFLAHHAIFTLIDSGIGAAIISTVIIIALPMLASPIIYWVEKVTLRNVEGKHGDSGIDIKFSLFEGYKSL